jgi:hypothetical protein
LDQPVSDSTLLLALLRGVNEPLRSMASILKTKTPLASFLEAQSLLALEESELPASTATPLLPSRRLEVPPHMRLHRRHRCLLSSLLPQHQRHPVLRLVLGGAARAKAGAITTGVLLVHGPTHGVAPSKCGLCLAKASWALVLVLGNFSSIIVHRHRRHILLLLLSLATPTASTRMASTALPRVVLLLIQRCPGTRLRWPTPSTQ